MGEGILHYDEEMVFQKKHVVALTKLMSLGFFCFISKFTTEENLQLFM